MIDERHATFGGTSAAAAIVSGAAGLLVAWWLDLFGRLPSPAMIKAILVNEALDNGAGPNYSQGWGRLYLKDLFNSDNSFTFVDRNVVTEGECHEFYVESKEHPVKISLVWDDVTQPSTNNNAVINQLVLCAQTNSKTFFGNNFSEGWSVFGYAPDLVNNVQKLVLPAGIYRVSIRPVRLLGRANESIQQLNQDYSLVVKNATVRYGTRTRRVQESNYTLLEA